MKNLIPIILLLVFVIPHAGASNLSALVLDENNKPVSGAIVSYQNGEATTDSQGRAIINNIPANMSWQFTISADNYNIHTEAVKLTLNDSYKTFRITAIESIGGTAVPTATKAPAPIPDINIRIHVTDKNQAVIPLAAVNVLGKLRYTNIYGDVDFPVTKGLKKVEVAISKKDYSSFTQTYLIPEELTNDDFRVEVQLTSVFPDMPQIFDVTRMESPISPEQKTTSGRWGIALVLIGLITILYPMDKKGGKK